MSTSQIGVRLADNSFLPVFTDTQPAQKRVLLTTSHTDQECVDIVLCRRHGESDGAGERLGHVLLCDIASGTPDASEIELILKLAADGTIAATAIDHRSGNRRDVSIDPYEAIPEYTEQEEYVLGEAEQLVEEPSDTPGSKNRVLIWGIAVVILLALLFLIWWFLLRPTPPDSAGVTDGDRSESVPTEVVEADEAPAPEQREPVQRELEPEDQTPNDTAASAGAAPPDTTAPDAAAPDTTSPDTASPNAYQIQWGDTLWDISRVFYGTPWRFNEIAEENQISDPDRIFADDEITLP